MRLRTGLIVTDGNRFPKDIEMGQFELDGTEEEITVKLIRNLAAVLAKHEDPENFSSESIKKKRIELIRYFK